MRDHLIRSISEQPHALTVAGKRLLGACNVWASASKFNGVAVAKARDYKEALGHDLSDV